MTLGKGVIAKKKPSGEDPRITKYKQEIQYQDLLKSMRKDTLKDDDKKRENELRIIKIAQIKAMRALDKEAKYEKRMEYEQQLKENKRDEDMEKEFACEQKKKENLMRTLIENRREPKQEEEHSKVKLENIQRDLSLRIILQRKKLIHRLNLIKLAHERKRSQMKQNIMNIRRGANQESTNQNKEGNGDNCIFNIGKESKMRNYCTMAFSQQAETMIECKK